MEEKKPVLQVTHFTKDYGYGRGVFDASIEVYPGECFGYLGPNGAGKSTTIRHIMGFSKPDKGEILVFGNDAWKCYSENLRRIGYIPGEIVLPAGLSGEKFLTIQQEMCGIKNNDLKNELIDYFELTPAMLKTDTKRMSLGVKRKLAIVSAFMSDPEVYILDEPTSGLDPRMQNRFVEYILKQKEKGKTILLSSHIFSEVDAVCDRIAIIKEGRIVNTFHADELRHAANKTYEVTFGDDSSLEQFASAELPIQIVDRNDEKKKLVFVAHDKEISKVLTAIKPLSVIGFSNHKESLQDYFMRFYVNDKNFGGLQ